jgi:hypothetical protein
MESTSILIEHLHIPDSFNCRWLQHGPIGRFLFWRHCMGLLWTHVNVPFFTTDWLTETPATTARTRQAAMGPYDNLPDMADTTPEEMNIHKAFTALYSRLHVPSYKIRPLATAVTKWASQCRATYRPKRHEVSATSRARRRTMPNGIARQNGSD